MKKRPSQEETLPLADQIAHRAYSLWEAEGRPEGAAVEHWLRAEAEVLLGKPSGAAGETAAAADAAAGPA